MRHRARGTDSAVPSVARPVLRRRAPLPWGRGSRWLVVALIAGGIATTAGPAAAGNPARHHGEAARAALAPPAVPSGVYLGAWVLPDRHNGSNQSENQVELSQLGGFQAAIGRNLAVVHVYQPWSSPPSNPDRLAALASNATLSALSANGAIPMVDWGCGDTPGHPVTDTEIADGAEDAFITAYAEQLKAYGQPVFLRWFWEPNLVGTAEQKYCMGDNDLKAPPQGPYAAEYVKAFQHIYDIFKGPKGVGATNVDFVWNPGLGGNTNPAVLQGLYPGSTYVDWVGVDGYSRPAPESPPNPSFATLFGAVYHQLESSFYGTPAKPVLIGETGAITANQPAFLSSVSAALDPAGGGAFRNVHAVVYYDSTNTSLGAQGQWALGPAGLRSFAQLAQDPTFATPGP